MGKQNYRASDGAAGFSLFELVIAMTITVAITAIAGTLLAGVFKIRTREHARTDAMADVQRSLNIMSRELAIGGFGFDNASNGLVVGDTNTTTLRVISNLNRYTTDATKYTIADPGEDIKYQLDTSPSTKYLVRYDRFAPVGTNITVLANRIDSLSFTYLDAANNVLDVTADPSQVANAAIVRITVGVNLPAVGKPGDSGYQPASTVQLTSDVALRNKKENLDTY
jgi:type II secretory pathway pseudopilin PulG